MPSNQRFREKYGPWAIVTGCTSGIGEAIATQLAERGINLVLVARREAVLRKQSENFGQEYRVGTRTLCLDLAQPGATGRLAQATDDIDIGLLVVNAAVEYHGEFFDRGLDAHEYLLQLNVTASMQMARIYGEKMLGRGRGGMLLVSSMGGYTPQPYIAHYGASKAYLSSLGEALHRELKGKGVDVTVLAAGLTDTPMGAAYHKMQFHLMSPDDVARAGLEAIGRTPLVVPGLRNKMTLFLLGRLIPRKLAPMLTAAVLKKTVLQGYPGFNAETHNRQ